MLKVFWRQRRRFVAVAVLAALSGLAANTEYPAFLAPALVAGFVIGLAAATLLKPQCRLLLTRMSIFFLISAIVSRFLDPVFLLPLMGLAVVLAAFVQLPAPMSELLRIPGISQLRAARTINADPDLLWDWLLPRATNNHWDASIAGIEATRLTDKFFIVFASQGYDDVERLPIQVFDIDPGRSFKIRNLSHRDVNDGGAVQVTQYTIDGIEGRPGTARVTLHDGTWRPEVMAALDKWLDDLLGDELEHIAAQLEERRDYSITARGWSERFLTGT